MAITSRDLFFILRAKDEATSVFSKVAVDLGRLGAAAEAASARAQAAALRQQAANMRASGATAAQIAAVEEDAAAWEAQARSIERAYEAHQKMATALRSTGQSLMLVGGAMVVAGGAFDAALLSTVKDAVEYRRQVSLTATQVDGFSASLDQLGELGKSVASKIAVPFEDVQPTLYNIFSSTNANLAQAKILMDAFAKASVAGQVSIDEASKGTMALLNAFHIPFENVNQLLDIQFQLVRKGVGTYADFNSTLGRVIPSAARAGQDFQTVAAMLAFMTREGLSAANASTSAARALDAISNPKTLTNLKAMGVTVADVHGNFLPLVDILGQMNTKMQGLSETARSQFLADAFKGSGGTIQALRFFNEVFKPGQFADFVGFLDDMNNATGQFGKAYSTMADTTASKTQLLKNNWQILKTTVGEILTPALNSLVTQLTKLLQYLNNLPEPTKKFIVQAALVAGAVTSIAGAITAAGGFFTWLAGALAALGLSVGDVLAIVALVVIALAGLIEAFKYAWHHSDQLKDALHHLWEILKKLWDDFKRFGTDIKNIFMEELFPSLITLYSYIKDTLVPEFEDFWRKLWTDHKKDITELKNWLEELARVTFKGLAWIIDNVVIPVLKDLEDMYNRHKTGIRELIDVVEWISKEFIKFGGATVLLAVVAAILGTIAVVALFIWYIGQLIDKVAAIVNGIKEFIGWCHDLGNAIEVGIIKFILWLLEKVGEIPPGISQALSAAEAIAKNAFSGAASWLIRAGEDVMNGFINGIKNKITELKILLATITAMIGLHKGPPEKDRKLLYDSGKLVMQGFMSGINSMVPSLHNQLGQITTQVQQQVQVVPVQGGAGTTNNVTLNTTINTNEIDPQRNADALGRLLVGRIA